MANGPAPWIDSISVDETSAHTLGMIDTVSLWQPRYMGGKAEMAWPASCMQQARRVGFRGILCSWDNDLVNYDWFVRSLLREWPTPNVKFQNID